jgi:hypothetical protein
MDRSNISEVFLRDNAAKHCLCMGFRIDRAALGTAENAHVSCFVLDAEGAWFLITAGHVIADIKAVLEAGNSVSNFVLYDRLAGNSFPLGVTFSFSVDDWAFVHVEEEGSDYAAMELIGIVRAGLERGGVTALQENTWGDQPFDQYPLWALVGLPRGSFKVLNPDQAQINLHLAPLAPAVAPDPARALPDHRVYAKLLDIVSEGSKPVADIAGMSGGPVFAIRQHGDQLRYWVIGIQSGWLPASRIVYFCPIGFFAGCLREAVVRFKAGDSGSGL